MARAKSPNRIILLSVMLVFIGFIVYYQILVESKITHNKLETLNIANADRQNHSIYLFYEIRRLIDKPFSQKQRSFANCYYRNHNLNYWDPRWDYYILNQYKSENDIEDAISKCDQ